VESNARDVICVSLEGEDCGRIGRFDVIKLNGVMAGSGEVAFVRRDAQAVYLAVWMGNCAGANATEGFPEASENGLVLMRARGVIRMHTELCGRSQLRGHVSDANLPNGGTDVPVQRMTLPLMVAKV